jgi:hypothetical protein
MNKHFGLIIVWVQIFMLSSKAQFNYVASDASAFQSVYNDLGSSGSRIATTFLGTPIQYDDTISSVQNIGFNFIYNGNTFQNFVLSTNGFIRLGVSAPTADNFDFNASAEPNILAPFNIDLDSSQGAEYRVATIGVQPNRVCVIQFKGLKDIALLSNSQFSNQFSNINFQIRLYETINRVEFVYGSFVPTANTSAVIPVNTGIKGSSSAYSVLATRTSVAPWLSTGFLDGPYFKDRFNIRNSLPPQAGFTLRFNSNPRKQLDAMVAQIYSMAEMPLGLAFPHSIKARVKNMGLQTLLNVPVYLNITGENNFSDTQYVSSLSPGGQVDVQFDSYTALKLGLNLVTVDLASDSNNANNRLSQNQRINEGFYSFADTTRIDFSAGLGNGAGIISVRYPMNGKALVTGVRVFISGDSSNIGKPIYGAVQSAGGFILGKSAVREISAFDLKKFIELPLIQSVEIDNTSFNAGIGCLSGPVSYSPIGVQFEGTPTRSSTYFTSNDQGAGLVENTTGGTLMIQAMINSFPRLDQEPLGVCQFSNVVIKEKRIGSVFQWQMNKGDGFVNIADTGIFSGTSGSALNLKGAPSHWYGYQFACLVDGIRGAVKSLRFINSWVGPLNGDWAVPANWSCEIVPDENTDVYFGDGSALISNPQQCRSLFSTPASSIKILKGARLNIRH